MPTNYDPQDVKDLLAGLEAGRALTDKEIALVKNMMAALATLQAQCLYLRRELNIAKGDLAQIDGILNNAGAGIENLLSDFKPGRNSFTAQEVRDTVSAIQRSVVNYNDCCALFTGVLSKIPLLF
jgi:hypothetical protein